MRMKANECDRERKTDRQERKDKKRGRSRERIVNAVVTAYL